MAVLAVAVIGMSASVAQEDPLTAACADAPQGRFADVSGVHAAGVDCIGWWGVSQGTGDGSYVPDEPLNRAQMATFVARAIELSGGVLPEDAPSAFDDTADSVHAAAIDALAALEVVGGVGGGLYAPERVVTRGQMATFLVKAWVARTGEPIATGEVSFSDIEDSVHVEAIAAITAAGWTGGAGPDVYAPGQAVTRAQMGTFLARWLSTLVDNGHATYPPAEPVPLPERDDPGTRQPHAVGRSGQVAAGYTHSCALRQGGGVACWGLNASGQLGDGSSTDRTAPVAVDGIGDAVGVAAGEFHTCARRESGGVACWGQGRRGQLGDSSVRGSPSPVDVTALGDAAQITAGEGHSCAVRDGGTIVCWGSNYYGQLGDGTIQSVATPVTVTGIDDAVQVAAGSVHTCALREGGTVACWGWNGDGELGDGTTDRRFTPVAVPGLGNVVQVAGGQYFTCALRADGTVVCWGRNDAGQLGDGTQTSRSSPTEVARIDDAVQIAAGYQHACAVREDGTVICWGWIFREPPDEDRAAHRPPETVAGADDVVELAAGRTHTCAVHTGGVMCWGQNWRGQLGNGTTDFESPPVAVVDLD